MYLYFVVFSCCVSQCRPLFQSPRAIYLIESSRILPYTTMKCRRPADILHAFLKPISEGELFQHRPMYQPHIERVVMVKFHLPNLPSMKCGWPLNMKWRVPLDSWCLVNAVPFFSLPVQFLPHPFAQHLAKAIHLLPVLHRG